MKVQCLHCGRKHTGITQRLLCVIGSSTSPAGESSALLICLCFRTATRPGFPHLPHRERLQTTGYRFRISVGQCQSVEMFFSFSYLTLICLLIKLNLLMFSRVYFDDLSYQINGLARMRH